MLTSVLFFFIDIIRIHILDNIHNCEIMLSRFLHPYAPINKIAVGISSKCSIMNLRVVQTRRIVSDGLDSVTSPCVFMKAVTISDGTDQIPTRDKKKDQVSKDEIAKLDEFAEILRKSKHGLKKPVFRDKLVEDFVNLSKSVLDGKIDVNEFVNSDTFQEFDHQVQFYIDLMNNSQIVNLLCSLIKMRLDPTSNLVQLMEHEVKFRVSDLKISQIIKLIKFYQSIEITFEQKQVVDLLNYQIKSRVQNENLPLKDLLDLIPALAALPSKDILLSALEERLLYILATDNFNMSAVLTTVDYRSFCKLFIQLAKCGRRPTPIIKQASLIMSDMRTSQEDVDVKELVDLLGAISKLNYPNRPLISKILEDFTRYADLSDLPTQYKSNLLHHLCLLRWRSDEVMGLLFNFVLENHKDKKQITPVLIADFLYTTALLNYRPEIDLRKLLESCMSQKDEQSLYIYKPRWLTYVWTLAALDLANENHFDSILNSMYIKSVKSIVGESNFHGCLMKIMNINAIAKYKYKFSCADPSEIQDISHKVQRGASLQRYASRVDQALMSISSHDDLRIEVDTPFGFNIDCEMILDNDMNPKSMTDVPTLADILANPSLKLAPDGHTRFAFIYTLFSDTITNSDAEVDGHRRIAAKILRNIGYQVVFLPEPVISREKTSSELILRIKRLIEDSKSSN